MTAACRPAGDETPPGPAPSRSDSKVTRFIGLWNAPLLDRPLVCAILLIAVVSLCLLRAYAGLSGIRVYSHDAFGALDGACLLLSCAFPIPAHRQKEAATTQALKISFPQRFTCISPSRKSFVIRRQLNFRYVSEFLGHRDLLRRNSRGSQI